MSKRKLKLTVHIMLATSFQISSKTAVACCPRDSSSSRTVRQHTQHAVHRTGCGPTVQISSKDQWPPNSPDLNLLWGAMLKAYHKLETKPKKIAELKEALQAISRDNLPQGPIDKAVKDFSRRLNACVGAGSGHFKHSQ